jgi:hypothetical protein
VFDTKALRSVTHLPLTLEHPSSPVTPANWRDHATGETGDEVLRDGGTIRVPLMLRDAKAIAAFKDGSKRQLSVGYSCDLRWQDGVVPAGEPNAGEAYDAIQENIRANHLAQCAAARGGPILTIGDNKENAMNLKTVMVDSIACERFFAIRRGARSILPARPCCGASFVPMPRCALAVCGRRCANRERTRAARRRATRLRRNYSTGSSCRRTARRSFARRPTAAA